MTTNKIPTTSRRKAADAIPMSHGPEPETTANDYKVLVVSDLHMNHVYKRDPSQSGPSKQYTYFGNEMADGFFKALKGVDELVLAGDTFDYDKIAGDASEPLPYDDGSWNKSPQETMKHRLRHRNAPEAFLEQILHENPHLKITYLVGNHEANSASDKSEYIDMLERLQKKYSENGYSRFSYADQYQNSNLLVFHGHSHIDYNVEDVIAASGKRGRMHLYDVYTKVWHTDAGVLKDPEVIRVSASKNKDMAIAIAKTDMVQNFIESQLVPETTGHDASGTKDLYVAFGHRHRGFDTTLKYKDFAQVDLTQNPHEEMRNVNLHVADLGHTKTPNFKIYHFDEGEVSRVEKVNLSALSRNGNGNGHGKNGGNGHGK